jgi:hypothetical protein
MASGVSPHAEASWRAKYEYMDKLWLKQKEEIAALKEELAKIHKQFANAEAEIKKLTTVIEEKDAEIVKFTVTMFAML